MAKQNVVEPRRVQSSPKAEWRALRACGRPAGVRRAPRRALGAAPKRKSLSSVSRVTVPRGRNRGPLTYLKLGARDEQPPESWVRAPPGRTWTGRPRQAPMLLTPVLVPPSVWAGLSEVCSCASEPLTLHVPWNGALVQPSFYFPIVYPLYAPFHLPTPTALCNLVFPALVSGRPRS